MGFQFRPALAGQALPVVLGGYLDVPAVGGPGVFIAHLQEQQEGQLLQIIAVADAVIAEDVAE